jgi:hypothetical protein
MPQVTMTMEEYLALINGLNGDAILGSGEMNTAEMTPPAPKKKKGKKNPKLKRAVTEANRRMRLKSGKLRKGKTQADVMRLAHRLLKKM